MLINCPRCGFSQPKDQYCAQCGVDMQSFKPKTPPIYQRLFANAGVQIALLLVVAVLVGNHLIKKQKTETWLTSDTAPQSESRSSLSGNTAGDEPDSIRTDEPQEITSASQAELNNLQNQEIRLRRFESPDQAAAGTAADTATNSSATPSENPTAAAATSPTNTRTFQVTYAEVTHEVLTRWISDSSSAGLYQSFPQYSAGILNNFPSRRAELKQSLNTFDMRLGLGTTNSNISGSMTEDGAQLLGLITSLEYRSNENGTTSGSLNITKNTGQTNESYPAEFHLPKGASFFIIGALRPTDFADEKSTLYMPPFQILKSAEFTSGKTEFVIIVEPQ